MALTPNIDQRGRTLRLIAGAMIEGPGWIILVLRFVGIISGEWPWFVGGLLVVIGLFLLLEGALGWCALKALGVGSRE
jgi:hypothetical protein